MAGFSPELAVVTHAGEQLEEPVDAELKGVLVRLEVGPRDLAEGTVVLARRIERSKASVALPEATARAVEALDADQQGLYDEALARREDATTAVDTIAEACRAGWATIPWARLGAEGEAELAARGVSVRRLTRPDGTVPDGEEEPDVVAVPARSY